jgi:DNA recombination protein RmuC
MDSASLVIGLVLGVVIGLIGGVVLGWVVASQSRRSAAADASRIANAAVRQLLDVQREQFASDADQRDQFAQHELSVRHSALDRQLGDVRDELRQRLSGMTDLVNRMAADQAAGLASVASQIDTNARTTHELAATTHQLREALASTKARGQWGERMAEDILRLAGFVEHVNYRKQTALDDRRGIPDFTFLLPRGQVLYMDVKFPLAAYLRYLDAESDAERTRLRKEFLRDVRLRMQELARREYAADSAAINSVLLFIPNETISGFIHEHDSALFDDAMRADIVLCSPLTLFAMLGVIRQAADNLLIEARTDEILQHLGDFRRQWHKYADQLDRVGRSLASTTAAFDSLNGTRRRALTKPLDRIEALRVGQGIGLSPPDDDRADDDPVFDELTSSARQ